MARLALSVGGYVLGNMVLPGIGGALGGVLGAYIGGIVDQQLFGSETANQTVYGARMQDLRVQSSVYGSVIPALYGKGRLAANIIWMRGFQEEVRTSTETIGSTSGGGGGKGGGGSSSSSAITRTNVEYHYYCDVAIGLCQGPIASVPRAFADGNALDPAHVSDMRVYTGSQTQGADPLIQAVEGTATTPAYRGLAYVVLEHLHITPYGNRLPQLSFEVVT